MSPRSQNSPVSFCLTQIVCMTPDLSPILSTDLICHCPPCSLCSSKLASSLVSKHVAHTLAAGPFASVDPFIWKILYPLSPWLTPFLLQILIQTHLFSEASHSPPAGNFGLSILLHIPLPCLLFPSKHLPPSSILFIYLLYHVHYPIPLSVLFSVYLMCL